MSNIITLKNIKDSKQTWSGFLRYKNTKDHIAPYMDSTGTVVTGLTRDDEERLGKLLKKDLSPSSPFWYEYSIIMMDKPKDFNLDIPEHELAYKFMLAHMRVANSITDRHQFPYADYVIYNEETEAQVKNKEFTNKRKANIEFEKLSLDQMVGILKLYPNYANLTSVSPDVISAKLYEELEKDSDKFLRLIGDKKLDMKIFLKDLVAAAVLRKNKSAYYYGDDNIGHDEESTITYLEDPENNGLKVALSKELANKTKKEKVK